MPSDSRDVRKALAERLTVAVEEAAEYVKGNLELRTIEVADLPPRLDAPPPDETPASDAER